MFEPTSCNWSVIAAHSLACIISCLKCTRAQSVSTATTRTSKEIYNKCLKDGKKGPFYQRKLYLLYNHSRALCNIYFLNCEVYILKLHWKFGHLETPGDKYSVRFIYFVYHITYRLIVYFIQQVLRVFDKSHVSRPCHSHWLCKHVIM